LGGRCPYICIRLFSRGRVPTLFSGVPTPFSGVPTPFSGVPTSFSGVPTPFSGVPTPFSGVPIPFNRLGDNFINYFRRDLFRRERKVGTLDNSTGLYHNFGSGLDRLYYRKRNIFKTNSRDPKWDCHSDK
tara:strand:+ start:1461 stop:1850 length:390 start_codon:yes stop_codon:yes gene_type:complete